MALERCKKCNAKVKVDFLRGECVCTECKSTISVPCLPEAKWALENGDFDFAHQQYARALELDLLCFEAVVGKFLAERRVGALGELLASERGEREGKALPFDASGATLADPARLKDEVASVAKGALAKGDFALASELCSLAYSSYPDDSTLNLYRILISFEAKSIEELASKENLSKNKTYKQSINKCTEQDKAKLSSLFDNKNQDTKKKIVKAVCIVCAIVAIALIYILSLNSAINSSPFELELQGGAFIITGVKDIDTTYIEVPSKIGGIKVTEIADKAFYEKKKLESVYFEQPSSLKRIGDSAFEMCTSLNAIYVPSGVVEVGNMAFYATNIDTLSLPETVTSIGSDVCAYCENLFQVRLPSTLTEIPDRAFIGCVKLSANWLNMGSATDNWEGGLRRLPLTKIGESAFEGCVSFSGLWLPSTLVEIEDRAFYNAVYSTDAMVYESISIIGSQAFGGEENSIILTNALTKPSGWASDWNGEHEVVWGYQ